MEVLRWAGRRPAAKSIVASLALAALLLHGPAWALSVDSRSQLHAVIGQPLAVDLPVSFAGINPNAVSVQVTPGPGLPDEEVEVAESVQAAYDAARSVVRLSTAQRVMVPTIRLHLVVTAGTLVVNSDVDVLVDVPDLNTQHFARPDAAASAASAAPAAPSQAQAPALRLYAIQPPPSAPPAKGYGDSAAAAPDAAAAQRPNVTPPPPPPPPDPRPKTWRVHPGETLSGISRRLAEVYAVDPDALSLTLYEANSQAFAGKNPEQAIAGRLLQVPEEYVTKGQPAGRVAEFRAWLRQPVGTWQPRAFQSLTRSRTAAQAQGVGVQPLEFLRAIVTVAGLALLLLLVRQRLRRIRLRSLTRYVPMSAIQVRKVKRIIIPAPPPRRGLSQGSVTEKLRIKRLREVLDQNPFRSDIRYRLAQRLHKAGDGRTFAQIALPLRPSLSPEAWARICAMGRELLPDDPRFLLP